MGFLGLAREDGIDGVHREVVLALGSGICRVSRLRGEAGVGASGWEGPKTVVGPKDPWVALGARPKEG